MGLVDHTGLKSKTDFNKPLGMGEKGSEINKQAIPKKKYSLATKKSESKTAKEFVEGQDFQQILRGTKGMTADDIMAKHPDIQLKRDVPAKDIHGNKVVIPKGEALTPYEVKGNKILLQDGETYIVTKNQYANIKGQSISGETKPFAPELEGLEETVKGTEKVAIREKAYKDFDEGKITREERNKIIDKLGVPNETKYSDYQLPEGKDYKEILIKAPNKYRRGDFSIKEVPTDKHSYHAYRGNELLDRYDTAKDAEKAISDHIRDFTKGDDFKSSHYEEPNVISHLRMNDRTYKGKKVSFMEELQSDWAAEVRKAPKTKYIAEKATNQPGNQWWVTDTLDEADLGKLFNTKKEAQAWIDENGGTPSHPLVKGNKWQELTVKRALKEAVDTNAEYFAWINGKQTSARYSLTTQLKNVKWEKTPANATQKGTYIDLNPKEGMAINIVIDKTGVIKGGKNNWQGKKLDEVLGKGLADKIMEKESGTLSGEGLKFGGEWASNLYDKQVANIVKDLTGAKVVKLDLGLPIEKGQTDLFIQKVGGKEKLQIEDLEVGKEIVKSIDTYIITDVLGNGKFKAVTADELDEFFGSSGFIQEYLSLKRGVTHQEIVELARKDQFITIDSLSKEFDISVQKATQQGIKLTPEIKAKIRGEAPKIKTSGKLFGKPMNPKQAIPKKKIDRQ